MPEVFEFVEKLAAMPREGVSNHAGNFRVHDILPRDLSAELKRPVAGAMNSRKRRLCLKHQRAEMDFHRHRSLEAIG